MAKKLAQLLGIICIIVLLLFSLFNFYSGNKKNQKELNRILNSITSRLSLSLGNALYVFDNQALHDNIIAEFTDKSVSLITVHDNDNNLIIALNKKDIKI